MKNQQLYAILNYYLKKAGIFFNKSILKRLIASHPDRNSLYAMADVLDELNLDNVALRVDMDGLRKNGFPVIIYTKKKERRFVVVDDITNEQVHYYDAETGRSVESLDDFASKWTGIALYAAQDEIQAELGRQKVASEKRLLRWRTVLSVGAGLACLAAWCISVAWSFTLICLLFLCLSGIAVSVLLAMHEFGESNRLIHKVCHLNRLTNCNAVLRSSAAKLFGWLSMSDIGLCYFAGSIFSLILAGIAQRLDTAVPWLLALALCSFPYTLFSLSYQTFKVKKFCPLCLAVIGVLWAETALAVFSLKGLIFFPLSSVTVFALLTGFALPVIVWAYVKPLWKEYFRIRNYEYRYYRLKRTPEVIRAMIAKEPACDMEFSKDEIHLGRIDASIHITVVLGLSCRPCVDGWNELNRWISTYPESFCLTVRFFGYNFFGTETEELIDTLTEIYNISGNDVFRSALTDWFANKDIQTLKAKYIADKTIASQSSSIKNAKWLRTHSITSVPAIFVGDRKFPFIVNDLEYLLKEQKDNG